MENRNIGGSTGVLSLSRMIWLTTMRLVSTRCVRALHIARLHEWSVRGAVSMSISTLVLASVMDSLSEMCLAHVDMNVVATCRDVKPEMTRS